MTTGADADGSTRVRGRAVRAPLARLALVVALVPVLATALGSCDPPAPPPRSWPAGTVVVLNGTPITADEVDAIGSIIARTEPDYVLVQLRRIALTNVLFQRLAAIQIAGPRYEEARKTAVELARALQAGKAPDPARTDILHADLDGNFKSIGLGVWNWGMDAPNGTWSDPIEAEGAFAVVRVESRSPSPVARSATMKISAWYVPYVQAGGSTNPVEDKLDRSKLEIVDPTWIDVVPESWKRRLRGATL
jgi:hypothetical protein